MVVFPREEPVIENLNSYYLDASRLLEHYQGQLDSGAIDFKSSAARGAIFFDKDAPLEGVYESREERLLGKRAVERLLRSTNTENYNVAVFKLEAEEVYYWASLLEAERVYANLSAEFTDLQGLIRKMSGEKLSGYIEISLGRSGEEGLIFFRNGLILGGAYSRENGNLDRRRESREAIIQEAKAPGGVFHVSRIVAAKRDPGRRTPETPGQNILGSMEELLVVLEALIHGKKATKGNFVTLLRKKFIDLAETYPFLDPFAGEFTYDDHKIRYIGDESEGKVAEGLLASLRSVAEESGVQVEFEAGLGGWLKKHGGKMSPLGIKSQGET